MDSTPDKVYDAARFERAGFDHLLLRHEPA